MKIKDSFSDITVCMEKIHANQKRSVAAFRRVAFACAALLCILLLLCALSGCGSLVAYNGEGHLRVHFLDVGQTDCAFVEFSRDYTMLIDASDAEHADFVCDYVKALGYNEIDVMVISHAHSDHVGGAEKIIEKLDVGRIFFPQINYTTPEYENMVSAANENSIEILVAEYGTRFDFGMAECTFVSPDGKRYEDENDGSAVLRILYDERSFLFMGDCGADAEGEMLGASVDLCADVVKVGHHGSNGSSGIDFVRATGAGYAIISCSADNEYGHPSPYAVDRWKSAGATVLATDEYSTIIAATDGKALLVGAASDREFWNGAKLEGVYTHHLQTSDKGEYDWILNTESHIIHRRGCHYAESIGDKVREESSVDVHRLEAEGYRCCKHCFSQ